MQHLCIHGSKAKAINAKEKQNKRNESGNKEYKS
jgi:hypothetical protein